MDKTQLEHIKIYMNYKGRRVLTKALLLRENKKSIWIILRDGNIVKRNKKRDLKGGTNNDRN